MFFYSFRFSTIIVSALLLIGTVLDLMLQRKKFCRDGCRKNFKYDNYTYAVNPPLQPYTDSEKIEADGSISGNTFTKKNVHITKLNQIRHIHITRCVGQTGVVIFAFLPRNKISNI